VSLALFSRDRDRMCLKKPMIKLWGERFYESRQPFGGKHVLGRTSNVRAVEPQSRLPIHVLIPVR